MKEHSPWALPGVRFLFPLILLFADVVVHRTDLRKEKVLEQELAARSRIQCAFDDVGLRRIDVRSNRMEPQTRAPDEIPVILDGGNRDAMASSSQRGTEPEEGINVSVRSPAGQDDPCHVLAFMSATSSVHHAAREQWWRDA